MVAAPLRIALAAALSACLVSALVQDATAQPVPATTDVAVPAPDDAPPPFPRPEDLPGGRAGTVFYIALAINRLLWALKRMRGLLPEAAQPYLPFLAALLGLVAGILDSILTGAPWVTAILTGLAGAAGAVAWREGTRAFDHWREPKGPPSPGPSDPGSMSDGDLSSAAG